MNYALYIASYLVGAIPFGVLIARSKGVDITEVGSGNIGATNVWRALGPAAGATTFALDLLKGLLPALAGLLILGEQYQALICGGLAILGHTFSPFLRFKGGKGVATGLGAVFGFAPLCASVALAVFAVLFALTRIVSLSSLIAMLAALVASVVLKQPLYIIWAMVALAVYIVYRHRGNIARLANGSEPRFEFKKVRK